MALVEAGNEILAPRWNATTAEDCARCHNRSVWEPERVGRSEDTHVDSESGRRYVVQQFSYDWLLCN